MTLGGLDQTHAYIAVDVVVFTVDEERLKALAVKLGQGPFAGRWAFPGGLVGIDEPLDRAARRELTAQTGLENLYLEQLRTFGDPERDPRARVVSTAYFALTPHKAVGQAGGKYAEVSWFHVDRLPPLAYDHNRMALCALDRLRAKLQYTNIVYGLLSEQFTLGELQHLYEIIIGRRLDRRNFRRKILGTGLLKALPAQRRGPHRPAVLYSFISREPTLVAML
jgi:8-oxo-dGTP diphosphatase